MNKWSIGKKLGGSVTGLVACIVMLGIASLWAASVSSSALTEMNAKILRKSDLAGALQVHTWTVRAELRGLLLASALKRPQDMQKARNGAEQAFTQVEGDVKEIRPLLVDPKAKAAAENIATLLPAWKAVFAEIADLAAAGKADAAYKVRSEKEKPLAAQIEGSPNEIRDGTKVTAATVMASAEKQAQVNFWLIVACIAIGMALGVTVIFLVRNTVRTLRSTVLELRTGGEQVAAASTQIASTSQSLSQGSSEQAASIEEVSASMEEMNAMAKRSADNSAEATVMMAETGKQVELACSLGGHGEFNERDQGVQRKGREDQ